jgi:glycosyltransferase involved in cell wall biosynthesis/ADP-heptose:LPS heptosyltransferase
MKKLLLKCSLPLGDNILLTAAVRDLHLAYPKRFLTAVETVVPEIWEYNPKIVGIGDLGNDVEIVDCNRPDIQNCNVEPYHYLHAFVNMLNEQLGVQIKPKAFKGDIHLSPQERQWRNQVQELIGIDVPFWLIVTGGKYDITAKWWPQSRYQEVVDYFRGKIQFVQVGVTEHHHPGLDGVIDLRGKTDLRQLIRLVYHADGVLCPVTSFMHLASAVETKSGKFPNRPCVVIAGGLEPSHWEAYPNHQFIHTNGALLCCDQGGCWKSRVHPLGDGLEFDWPENLCVSPVNGIPRCLDIISATQVIHRIELYFQGGVQNYLTQAQARAADSVLAYGHSVSWNNEELTYYSHRNAAEEFIATMPPYPRAYEGRGIVICGGGTTYFTNAWVGINILRQVGCRLPIQLWYLGENELDDKMRELVKSLDVECVDAAGIGKKYSLRLPNGWNLKPFALLHSRFKEVLLLDADNLPTTDPEYLFEDDGFKKYGAVFWPDVGRFSPDDPVWNLCGVEYRDEPQFESGQMLLDKECAWAALLLSVWYNLHSDVYYRYLYGDKDTYHLAFRKLRMNYAMPDFPVVNHDGVFYQHDFSGRRIFQHRHQEKWSLTIPNKRISGFVHENDCHRYVHLLRKQWDGVIGNDRAVFPKNKTEQFIVRELTGHRYSLCLSGKPPRPIQFARDGGIDGVRRDERWSWKIKFEQSRACLELYIGNVPTGCLVRQSRDYWSSAVDGEAVLRLIGNKPPKGRLMLRATLNTYTGYGLHAVAVITGLVKLGYDVKVASIGFDEKFSPIPDNVKARIASAGNDAAWELLLHPPNRKPVSGKKIVYSTMWETTRLPANGVDYLNMAECVIVPCRWNAENFTAQGVIRPIYQVPLGIDTGLYKYSPMELSGPCVFGAAGRLSSGGVRKGLDRVIDAFLAAFPSEPDVRLHVKAFPDCPLPTVQDPRIMILQQYLNERQMAQWYRSITCFVSAATGEAWGLMQHQALATGRPIISVNYGGVQEFFNKDIGYPLDFELVPADKFYANCGLWAWPSDASLVQRMRQVYENRAEAEEKGRLGARQVCKLSWQASNRQLAQVLGDVGIFDQG